MSVTLKMFDFGPVKNCLKLSNGIVDLIISTAFGPRILFYSFPGEKNLFKNFDDQLKKPLDDKWRSFGGHRLWHSPEVFPRTYYADNDKVDYEWDGELLTLLPRAEKTNNLGKKIIIKLSTDSAEVNIEHILINVGVWDVELAAWSLSVMAPGGRVIIPQEEFKPHPEYLLPSRPLVLWHFTKMNDPRFRWGERYIQLYQDDNYPGKQKIGVANTKGWTAYCLGDLLFIKEHDFEKGAVYPDMGCNSEFYTEPGFLEIETLSPLTKLVPGESVSHTEKWNLFKKKIGDDETDLDKISKLISK